MSTYDHERAVRVLQGCVGREDRVIGFNDGAAHFRSRVDTELEFRLLAVVGGEALHQ